jgi:anti-anti-sigma regulatory factor
MRLANSARKPGRFRQRRRAFVVCGLRDAVRAAFALAGLEGGLAIEPSRNEAVARAIAF